MANAREYEKRYSSKGELLRKYEWEIKPGRYRFEYRDKDNKKKFTYSTSLDVLREKENNIAEGHPELNEALRYAGRSEVLLPPRYSSKGELLNKGEYELCGRYKCECYVQINGEKKRIQASAATLELLREKEKNIAEGHPEKNKNIRCDKTTEKAEKEADFRYSSKGEELRRYEYELPNGYYKYEFKDKESGRIRSVNAPSLPELRRREKDIEEGRVSPSICRKRVSSKGEELKPYEYELKDRGRFIFCYKEEDKNKQVSAPTVSELREIEESISNGTYVPGAFRERKRLSPDGEILRTNEYYTHGRYHFSYKCEYGERKTTAGNLKDLRKKVECINNGIIPERFAQVRYDTEGELLQRGEYERKCGGYAYARRVKEKKNIQLYAKTLEELRKKKENALSGKMYLNTRRYTSSGRLLRKHECENKDGSYSFFYKDEDGNNKSVSARSLELLREKEKNIEDGHPELNRMRFSSKGELLESGEVEGKNQPGYWGKCWDKIQNRMVHYYASTLEGLREKKKRIEEEGYKPIIEIRYSNKGELLNVHETQTNDGKYHFTYKIKSENRWTSFSADSLEELRWKEDNVANGHPEWNRQNYTRDGERLFRNEAQLIEGKITYTLDIGGRECTFLAPDLDTLRDIKTTYYMGLHREESREGRFTVYEYFKHFFEERKVELKFRTYASYKGLIDRYLRDSSLGSTFLDSVTRTQVRDFLNGVVDEIRKNRANCDGVPTANSIHSLLSQLYGYAIDDGLADRDPTRNAKIKPESCQNYQTWERRALLEEEQKRFKKCIEDEYYEPHLLFLLCTGLRCAELLGLTWNDVDFSGNRIYIRRNLISFSFEGEHYTYTDTPKSKAGRRGIPLTRNLRKLLNMVKERCKPCNFMVDGISDFIFVDENGEMLDNSKLNSIITKYVNKANKNKDNPNDVDIPYFSCHSLRHTYLTDLARIRVPEASTKALAGHASIITTMNIYEEVQPDQLDEAGDMICSYFERLFGENETDSNDTEQMVTTSKEDKISAVATLIKTGKQYGATTEQILMDLKEMFGMERTVATDIVNAFWHDDNKVPIGTT